MEKFRKLKQKELKVNLTKREAIIITLLLGLQRILYIDDKIVEKRNVAKDYQEKLHVLKIIRRKEKAKIKNVKKYDLSGNENVRKVNEVLYQTKSLTKLKPR